MIEVEVAIAAIILLLIILIIYEVRIKASKKAKSPISIKTKESAKPSQIIKPADESEFRAAPKSQISGKPKADESAFIAEPQSGHFGAIQSIEPVFATDLSIEQETSETATRAQENRHENLPQDSMLRRHYFTHLRAMIESLKFARPTDSALSRHYNAMIVAEMEQCLSDEVAMERLVCNYEEQKKTVAQQIQIPEAAPEPLIEPIKAGINQEKPRLPEDSMLRRHYLTHLRALVESGMPPRPTDSTLRRHYDSMIECDLKNLL